MIDPLEDHDDGPFLGGQFTASDRLGLFAVAIVLGAIAAWIFWIVRTCLDGHGWFDFTVRLVLYDFVVSILIFTVGLAIYAAFLPQWLDRFLKLASKKLHSAIGAIFLLFGLTLVVLLFVLPVLIHFKLIK